MRLTRTAVSAAVTALLCGASPALATEISSKPFGTAPDGSTVDLFTLTNANGISVSVTEWGGVVQSVMTPDKDGNIEDIVLGHDTVEPYFGGDKNPFFGGIIGRYANRIAKGKFTLGGKEYTLALNNGENTLHGGIAGFDQQVWEGTPFVNADGAGVIFTRTSPDGEEGYPGNLELRVTYTLTDSNELVIDYFATTDAPTVVNLTNHSYWNLSGDAKRDILGHVLTIPASYITPTDAGGIPGNDLMGVAGTPFDFREPTEIGARINDTHPQIEIGIGYDHNWVLNDTSDDLKLAAELSDPVSGRTLEIWSNEPGIQFYTGNYLDGSITGKGGAVYGHRFGLCLEPQHHPDSPNHPGYPSTALDPGQTYETTSIYKFGVAE